jgi:hypothetical protein
MKRNKPIPSSKSASFLISYVYGVQSESYTVQLSLGTMVLHGAGDIGKIINLKMRFTTPFGVKPNGYYVLPSSLSSKKNTFAPTFDGK